MSVSSKPNLPPAISWDVFDPSQSKTPPGLVWRLNVEEYHQIISAGILTKNDPIELLKGWLVEKGPPKPRHRAATKLTRNALEAIVPQGWYVDSGEPITLSNSEAEPDVIIVRGETRDYLDRHPGTADLGLVVEVADATLERVRVALRMQHRSLKKRLYARAGISVYWIVNLPQQQLEVYTKPNNSTEAPAYDGSQIYRLGDEVTVEFASQSIGRVAVEDLFP